ncbi:hypothetical protein AC1031_016660 [Aphanomyces cochlioides]|nr:hypothetical protein AC1031_016660 [Aphanomyces cochlioides]
MPGRSRFFAPKSEAPRQKDLPGEGTSSERKEEIIKEEPTCVICLEGKKDQSLIDCSHAFCHACIVEWAKFSSSCPLCKSQFQVIWNVATKMSTSVSPVQRLKTTEDTFEFEPSDHTYGYDTNDGFVVPDDFVEFDDSTDLELLEGKL